MVSCKLLFVLTALPCIVALTLNECRAHSEKCQAEFIQSVQNTEQKVSVICGQARISLTCVQNLACESLMFLRIAVRDAFSRLTKRGIPDCEFGTYFPKDSQVSVACQQKTETCMNSYVDLLLEHDANSSSHATSYCRYLNTYATCETKPDSCVIKKAEVVKMVEDEKSRMLLSACTVTALNGGTVTTFRTVSWLSVLLVVAVNYN